MNQESSIHKTNLALTVVRADGLEPIQPQAGPPDPYVLLEHPAFGQMRTRVALRSVAPELDELFLCGMTRAQLEVPLSIKVLDGAQPDEDAVLGQASLDLGDVAAGADIAKLLSLARPDGAAAGKVELSIVHRAQPDIAGSARAVQEDASQMSQTAPPAKLDAVTRWRAGVLDEVRARGFLATWERRLPEFIHLHAVDPSAMLGRDLEEMMSAEPELRAHFAGLVPEARAALDASFAQPVTARARLDTHRSAVADILEFATPFLEIREGDGKPMLCLPNAVFRNWGRTVKNTPALTCLPRTKKGVANLVKWATVHGKKVRVSGYRHTWESLYSNDGEVLISLLPLSIVEDLPAREPPIDPHDELQGIRVVGTVEEDGVTKALCRIGAATTNEQFRRWCLDATGGNYQWTIPLNVIMVEITWGGSNAPICHGAGVHNRTLSDLVASIEFVNAKGEIQTVSDPEQLRAAAGCFGLLGVVTALTLKLDPMTYARMKPTKPRLAFTIPPPAGMTVPAGVDMTGVTKEALDNAWGEFVRRAEHDYYSEWFWFPYQKKCWVNTWLNDGERADSRDYPGPLDTFIQEAESYLAQLVNQTLFKILPARWQADLLASTAMLALPASDTIVTPLIDALHFRRGIQNMRVLDMELEIPIPPRADAPDKPDWTVCQKAWWAVINSLYTRHNSRDDAPMRVALEMRVMADSAMTMAPQHGNRFGTCSIEVLTTPNTSEQEWLAFRQEITDAWTSYKDASGAPLNVRPHWAKQWRGTKVHGQRIEDYLKRVAYKDRIPDFGAGLAAVAHAGGYTLADAHKMFSNPLLDDIFSAIFL